MGPISSYSSKKGSVVRAMVIESPECDHAPIFPTGTRIEGHVLNVHRVGLGFRHETAALEIEFDKIQPEGAPPLGIRARLLGVDNAREHVRKGVISGIRSINSPQDHLSARVGYLLTWHPDTMLILPAYHALFPVLPEAELYFPSGTDLLLKLTAPLEVADLPELPSPDPGVAPAEQADLDTMALSFPERTTTPKGRDADIVNVAFVGSAMQLSEAFEAAGWKRSETWSVPAVLGEISAFAMERNNSIGPMSKQLLQGNPSDSTWEKGLDSLAKRDHLRIWSSSATWNGDPIWLSSSTQDVSATLSLRKARFVHAIDPNVDNERERIVLDLLLAGCVENVDRVKRPLMAHSLVNSVGTEMHTDGAIAVVRLKDCDNPVFRSDPEAPMLAARPPKFERYVRTQILAARDMWRENVFYDAFSATRASVRAIRQSRANREAARRSLAAAFQTGPDPAMESEADITAERGALPSVSGLSELPARARP
jgi:LssY C-terminus